MVTLAPVVTCLVCRVCGEYRFERRLRVLGYPSLSDRLTCLLVSALVFFQIIEEDASRFVEFLPGHVVAAIGASTAKPSPTPCESLAGAGAATATVGGRSQGTAPAKGGRNGPPSVIETTTTAFLGSKAPFGRGQHRRDNHVTVPLTAVHATAMAVPAPKSFIDIVSKLQVRRAASGAVPK